MLTLQSIRNQFSNAEIYETLVHTMEKQFHDFPQVHHAYLHAMEMLQNELGEQAVANEKEAIRQETVSALLFSGFLGMKANLKYFIDPVAGDFLNVEPDIYLRENLTKTLPEYASAQEARKQFYSSLNDAQQKLYEAVTHYVCYLETVGPKLAHYYGFIFANTLLQRVVPGYQPDMAFTLRYCMLLEKFFGTRLDWNVLLKSSFEI